MGGLWSLASGSVQLFPTFQLLFHLLNLQRWTKDALQLTCDSRAKLNTHTQMWQMWRLDLFILLWEKISRVLILKKEKKKTRVIFLLLYLGRRAPWERCASVAQRGATKKGPISTAHPRRMYLRFPNNKIQVDASNRPTVQLFKQFKYVRARAWERNWPTEKNSRSLSLSCARPHLDWGCPTGRSKTNKEPPTQRRGPTVRVFNNTVGVVVVVEVEVVVVASGPIVVCAPQGENGFE